MGPLESGGGILFSTGMEGAREGRVLQGEDVEEIDEEMGEKRGRRNRLNVRGVVKVERKSEGQVL